MGMKKFNTWVLDITIYILDFLYRGRDFQRFWVLEVIARAPYFSFISVLHFRESLGLRGADHIYLMKEHFYQALNETEHLEEMELREGKRGREEDRKRGRALIPHSKRYKTMI